MLQVHTVTQFVLTQTAKVHGSAWLGATRSKNQSPAFDLPSSVLAQIEAWKLPLDARTRQRLEGVRDVGQLLDLYLLKGVRLDSHLGLRGLVTGAYPLRLLQSIPTPREVLDLQCAGERVVTLLDKDRPIGRFKGSYEFLLHDLEHAHKFFGDPDLFGAQKRFFVRLREALPTIETWGGDAQFRRDLDYLMSDMNSHPVHLFKYLKAITLTALTRADQADRLDERWAHLMDMWQMPPIYRSAGANINHPGRETSADQILIHDFFASPL